MGETAEPSEGPSPPDFFAANAQPRSGGPGPLLPGEDPHRLTKLETLGHGLLITGLLCWAWVVIVIALKIVVEGLGSGTFDAPLAKPAGVGLGLLLIGVLLGDQVASRSATVRRRQPHRDAAEKERRDARELANREKEDQLFAWDYDVAVRDLHRWPPRGFVRYDVLQGSMAYGQPAPAYSSLLLQLAPPGRPHLAARIAPQQPGPPTDIPIDDVIRVAARSRGASWFGFGATGAMAAHAASSLDRHLAGYELVLVSRSGFNLRLRVLGGAPPEAELQTIEARAAGYGY